MVIQIESEIAIETERSEVEMWQNEMGKHDWGVGPLG